MIKNWLVTLLACAGLVILIWASDHITMEGERTIYAVVCTQGAWDGPRCNGKIAAGDRYRFRSSHTRNEVVYWTAGSNATSGKHTDCRVLDRDNWTCDAHEGEPPSIAHELSHGRPTSHGGGLIPFCAVAKWKWWLLRAGFPVFGSADYCSGITTGQPRPGPDQ